MKLFSGAFLVVLAICFEGRANAFTYEDLRATIERLGLTTIPQVLAVLPEELLSNYTLMHSSGSLQGASVTDPRAILFGTDGKLVLTFNGDPAAAGYNELELVQYRDDSKRFDYYSIDFSDGVVFSEPNPARCLGCHLSSPRPRWLTYGNWPGSFAAEDALSTAELPTFAIYQKQAADHERYRYLRRDPANPYFPFTRNMGDIQDLEYRKRPNARLLKLLGTLNAHRIAEIVLAGTFFRRYPHVTLFTSLGCPGGVQFSQLDKHIDAMFEATFPREGHEDLYLQMALVKNKRIFQMDKLTLFASAVRAWRAKISTGLDVFSWSLGNGVPPQSETDELFTSYSLMNSQSLPAGQLMEYMAKDDPQLAERFFRITLQEMYASLPEYYINLYVPGGVGDTLTRIGFFYDQYKARQLCPLIYQRALSEVGLHIEGPGI